MNQADLMLPKEMTSVGSTSVGSTSMRTHLCAQVSTSDVDRHVRLCGWVARRREHGEHLAFIDLRDYTGIVQCVVDGKLDVRSEYVLAIEGVVRLRPPGTQNSDLMTGEVEIGDCKVEILGVSEPPPFPLDGRTDPDEALRLRSRYLDLRRPRLQANLRGRAVVNAAIREAMQRQGFCEVETPLLWAPTPEGSREFAVPSRLHQGSFYTLAQSPQLAKQLLMVGGFDRYYQIARCMRDEDLRADRQFEFTQLDLEASFVGQDDILEFVSEAVLDAAEAATSVRPGYIERLTWTESIERYGTDKPDLRFGMELVDLSDIFVGSGIKAFSAPVVKSIVVKQGASFSRSKLDGLVELAKSKGAKGLAWFKVVEANAEVALESPLDRFLEDEQRSRFVAKTGAQIGDLILVVADEYRLTCEVLGHLRVNLGSPPVSKGPHCYVWIVDFPMFDGIDELGNPISAHHPFTMPHPDDLEHMESNPLAVRSQAYDLVLNGWELGSGSVRIHRSDIQERIFSLLGISKEQAQSRFGFLLDAFRFGAPPHAGFAFGIDRLVAIFCGEENIREVIAFPKTQSGSDLLTGAPKGLSQESLRELGIRVVPNLHQ